VSLGCARSRYGSSPESPAAEFPISFEGTPTTRHLNHLVANCLFTFFALQWAPVGAQGGLVRNLGTGKCVSVPECTSPSCSTLRGSDNCVFILKCGKGLSPLAGTGTLVLLTAAGALLLLSAARLVMAARRTQLPGASGVVQLVLFLVTAGLIVAAGADVGTVRAPMWLACFLWVPVIGKYCPTPTPAPTPAPAHSTEPAALVQLVSLGGVHAIPSRFGLPLPVGTFFIHVSIPCLLLAAERHHEPVLHPARQALDWGRWHIAAAVPVLPHGGPAGGMAAELQPGKYAWRVAPGVVDRRGGHCCHVGDMPGSVHDSRVNGRPGLVQPKL
jgi:hypothetical protein